MIGEQKSSCDLWGDTVNTASRLESHGVAGEIQISAATRALLDGRFAIRERGPVEIKGKGMMLAYLLDDVASPAD